MSGWTTKAEFRRDYYLGETRAKCIATLKYAGSSDTYHFTVERIEKPYGGEEATPVRIWDIVFQDSEIETLVKLYNEGESF